MSPTWAGGGGYSLYWPLRAGSARKGHLFRLKVYERVGTLLAEVYERVGKSVIAVYERPQRADR